MDVTKSYKIIWVGGIHGPHPWPQTLYIHRLPMGVYFADTGGGRKSALPDRSDAWVGPPGPALGWYALAVAQSSGIFLIFVRAAARLDPV